MLKILIGARGLHLMQSRSELSGEPVECARNELYWNSYGQLSYQDGEASHVAAVLATNVMYRMMSQGKRFSKTCPILLYVFSRW